jgi:serine/threonine protein kinase
MAFKRPLPIIVAKKSTRSVVFDNDLPKFSKSDCTNQTVIGFGSFGKVSLTKKGNHLYVLKELNNTDAGELEHLLFLKEAKRLHSVAGRSNVVQFHGISTDGCALLLEYCCFSFLPLQIVHDPVYNLKELLAACDHLSEFNGFEHLQHIVASDIVSGLKHLHDKNIAHRDLKPHNILVTNIHYSAENDFDVIQCSWASKPVVAKLSDFGESRASLIQTRSLLQSKTINLNRGSPAYMAPEAINACSSPADLNELKQMDIWSTGMIMYHLLNPSVRHPYSEDIDSANALPIVEQLKQNLADKKLPSMVDKYKQMQVQHDIKIVLLKSFFYYA